MTCRSQKCKRELDNGFQTHIKNWKNQCFWKPSYDPSDCIISAANLIPRVSITTLPLFIFKFSDWFELLKAISSSVIFELISSPIRKFSFTHRTIRWTRSLVANSTNSYYWVAIISKFEMASWIDTQLYSHTVLAWEPWRKIWALLRNLRSRAKLQIRGNRPRPLYL